MLLFIERSAGFAEMPGASALAQRAEEIRVLERQIGWLDPTDVRAFLDSISHVRFEAHPLGGIVPLYQEAMAEEAKMVGAGVGENHPRLKALRAAKRGYADKIMAVIAHQRNHAAARLAELRKQ